MTTHLSIVILLWITTDGIEHTASRSYDYECAIVVKEMEARTGYMIDQGVFIAADYQCQDMPQAGV